MTDVIGSPEMGAPAGYLKGIAHPELLQPPPRMFLSEINHGVLMVLAVHRAPDVGFTGGGGDVIWTRHWPAAHLPLKGELVELWPGAEGDLGPRQPVLSRSWRADGRPVIELVALQVDPDEQTRRILSDGYRTAWETETDGDLEAGLRQGGWRDRWTD